MLTSPKSNTKSYAQLSPVDEKRNPKSIMKNAQFKKQPEVLGECQAKLHEYDVYLEKIKCKLALKVDFNLKDLFAFLDHGCKGWIDAYDLEQVCTYLQVRFEEENSKEHIKDLVKMFVQQYDKDYDGRLLFTDVGKAFLSKKQEYSQLVIERPSFYDAIPCPEAIFSLNTQKLIGQLLKMILYIERKQAELRKEIEKKNMQDEHFMQAFESMISIRY